MNALQRQAVYSSDFNSQLNRFKRIASERADDVFEQVVQEVHASIVHGSMISGAPGQPVDTGALRDSWVVEFVSPTVAKVVTSSPYAWVIEHNYRNVSRRLVSKGIKRVQQELDIQKVIAAEAPRRPGGQRKWRVTKQMVRQIRRSIGRALGGPVFRNGGPHSVKLTKAAYQRIVDHVVQAVRAETRVAA